MKLGCCAYSYRQLLSDGQMALEEFLDTALELGLDGVELTQYYFPEESNAYLNHIKRQAFARGLEVAGTAVGGNFSNADADARAKQIEHVRDWLVKSSRLGSPVLRVFAGGVPDGADAETAAGWVRDGLAECAAVAEEAGVVLALENHGGLTATADGVLALLAPFADNPWVGLNLDFGNFTGDVYEQYARCAPYVATTHAKVTHRQGDGAELVDYRRVVRIMRQAGYRGYLSIEYEEDEEPLQGVDRFAAYLRGCLEDA
ncbi:MAG: sugar phosphate isomerase/epimerase [Candidatus Brocadiia bacterium]